MRTESEKMLLKMKNNVISFEAVTFAANGSLQTWQVPAGVKQIHVDCVASQGGNSGGLGGRVECDLQVTPKQTLYIMVGSVPGSINVASYNAADIRIGGTEYANRVIVAGGGGSTSSTGKKGGDGGGLTGCDGTKSAESNANFGYGGTQTEGGGVQYNKVGNKHSTGNNGVLGIGGNGGSYNALGGSGGAGYYGGGGSGAHYSTLGSFSFAGGGGGGSSYTHPNLCANVKHTQGYRTGAGYIKISMVS